MSLCCAIVGAAFPTGAGAADRYDWSGTVTIHRVVSGDVLHNEGMDDGDFRTEYTISGTVDQFPGSDLTLYHPRVIAYHDVADMTGPCDNDLALKGTDDASDNVAAWVEWGRPVGDGSYYVPRFLLTGGSAAAFPNHGHVCLAYNGGAPMEYPYDGESSVSLESALACREDQGPPPGGINIGAPFLTPPPMPARTTFPDGRIGFAGTVTTACTYTSVGATSDVLTITYDLVGTPPAPAPIEVDARLDVQVHGTQYGSIIGAGGALSCGMGGTACSAVLPGGSVTRLAVQLATAGMFHFWVGCDQVLGYGCMVSMSSPRVVHAYFGYDFLGQWEPPPDGLFSIDRKAEIAGNGASAARDGAVGCGLTAGVIGGGWASGTFVVGGATVATRSAAFLEKVLEETIGHCAEGIAGTIYNGLLLKIDPPDPEWRTLALAERYPPAKLAPCKLARGCPAVTRARSQLVAANRRVMELQEALAVASNRYGNAANAKDEPVQALHQATMRATSGLLAEATIARNRSAAKLAGALRAAGVSRMVVPRSVVARAVADRRAGKGVPKAVVARLLRKRLITKASEVSAQLRASAPRKVAAYDALRALGRPVATRQMQAAADALTLGDVALLVDAVIRDTTVDAADTQRFAVQLEDALRCDAGSRNALYAMSAIAAGARGAQASEGRLLDAHAAKEVASHDLGRDPAGAGAA
jgi:hypothetical protein